VLQFRDSRTPLNLVAIALLALAVPPSVADGQFIPYQAVQLPDSAILEALGISFVDPTLRTLRLPLQGWSTVGTIRRSSSSTRPSSRHQGTHSRPAICRRLFVSGAKCGHRPNWVLVINKGSNAEVWAGDGPVLTTAGITDICSVTTGTPPNPVAGDIPTPSSVKVADLKSDFSKAPWNTTGCGLAHRARPDHQLANSCGLIINDQTGAVIANFESESGASEIWFNRGVVDAGPSPRTDLKAVTASGLHSVAADSVRNEVYVPIKVNYTSTLGGNGRGLRQGNRAFGNAGSDALLYSSYIAPRDSYNR
jgi:hypothetical protein